MTNGIIHPMAGRASMSPLHFHVCGVPGVRMLDSKLGLAAETVSEDVQTMRSK